MLLSSCCCPACCPRLAPAQVMSARVFGWLREEQVVDSQYLQVSRPALPWLAVAAREFGKPKYPVRPWHCVLPSLCVP